MRSDWVERRMLKICIITRNMKAGGAERVLSNLISQWINLGCSCEIILMDMDSDFYDIDEKINVVRIGEKSNIGFVDKFLRYKEVRMLVKNKMPDIVLSLPEEIGIYVILALLGSNIPVVVSERNNPRVMPYKRISRIARRMAYPFTKGLIFQTEEAMEYFPKKLHKKSVILANPINISTLPFSDTLSDKKVVIGVGRLEKQKNFPMLIKAFGKFIINHPDFKLLIFGEGAERSTLIELASMTLPPGSYFFPGVTKDLPSELREASIFVLSSDYEGMPNVLIEAMASGVPCIATDCPVGGPRRLIGNNEAGILVPIGDENSLAIAMSQIADSSDLANMWRANARKKAETFDSAIIAQQWLDYLYAASNQNS